MKIQIYGSGCDKCKKLYENVETVLKNTDIKVELEKVSDMNAIVEAGILITPALAIDGKVVAKGKVLSVDEISTLLGVNVEIPSNCCCNGDCSSTKVSPLKRIITIILLLLVVTAIGMMIYRENIASKREMTPAVLPVAENLLTVYYFHGNQRCFTCNKIEELTRDAVEQKYADQIKSGRVVFRSINVDEAENEHFIKDFGLDSKIVVMQEGDKLEKFTEVWSLVREPEKFTAYIQNGVEAFLK